MTYSPNVSIPSCLSENVLRGANLTPSSRLGRWRIRLVFGWRASLGWREEIVRSKLRRRWSISRSRLLMALRRYHSRCVVCRLEDELNADSLAVLRECRPCHFRMFSTFVKVDRSSVSQAFGLVQTPLTTPLGYSGRALDCD